MRKKGEGGRKGYHTGGKVLVECGGGENTYKGISGCRKRDLTRGNKLHG